MQNWFNTLSEALQSENIEGWPMDGAINYGETGRHYIGNEVVIIYRYSDGMYGRPIHYRTL